MAAGEFPGPVSFELSDLALSAVAMPFNVDGSDFIVAGAADGSLTMTRFNEGTGRFTNQGRLPIGGEIVGLARWEGRPLADQGIVAITRSPDRLHFMAASPTQPAMTPLSYVDLPEDPGSLAFVGDLGLGRRDLAVSLPGMDRIHIYVEDGESWRLHQVLEAGDRPERLVGMDLDGDQVRELVASNRGPLSGNFGVYRRDQEGFYQLEIHPFDPGLPGDIVAFDRDGDGCEELFATVEGQPLVAILEDLGDGLAVTDQVAVILPGERLLLERLFDGSPAMFLTNRDRGLVSFLRFTQGAWRRVTDYYPGCKPAAILSAELNGDGGRDLVFVGDQVRTCTGMLANPQPGYWGLPALTLSGPPGPSALGDFDGDGFGDLVVFRADQPRFSFFPGLPTGGFQAEPIDADLGFFPGQAVALQADGDQALEVAVLDPLEGQVSLLEYQPGVGFVEASRTSVGTWPFFVTSGDLDGDGSMDLLIIVREASEVRAVFGGGDGTFEEVVPVSFGGVADYLAALDLNGDGRLELVASDGNNRIWFHLNQDGRSFGNLDWRICGTGVLDLAVGDLDGDQDEDLVSVNTIDRSLSFFENNGNGGLVRRIGAQALATAPTDIAVGDLNLDGVNEVILNLPDESRLAAFFAQGAWIYSGIVGLGEVPHATSISLADINLDDTMDILAVDKSLQLGLSLLNVEQVLVAAEPEALTASCRQGRLEVRVQPEGGSAWLLEAGQGQEWRTLAADGHPVAGELDFERGAWIVAAEPGEWDWWDGDTLVLKLTVGGVDGVVVTEKQVGLSCLQSSSETLPSVTWDRKPWPNPFNPLVHARFNLTRSSIVLVAVYDLKGRLVEKLAAGRLEAGVHDVSWNGAATGRTAGAGVYFLRVDTPEMVLTQKLMLLK